MATDNAETQLLVPTEDYVNTNEMKDLLAKENVLDGHPEPGSASGVEKHEVARASKQLSNVHVFLFQNFCSTRFNTICVCSPSTIYVD